MVRSFFLLLVAVLVVSALLTPPIYSLLVLLLGAEDMWPFSRIFDRVVMLSALFFLVVFRRRFSLHEVKESLTAESLSRGLGKTFCWMTVSFCLSLVVLILIVGRGEIVWTAKPLSYVAYKMALVVPAALLISLIEESFFRVILFNGLKSRFPVLVAAIVSSLLYAIAHFVSPVKSFAYTKFDLWAGFEYLTVLLDRFFEPGVLSAGCGLFFVGLVLCYAVSTSRSLYVCLGLHSGWVAIIKLAQYATDVAPGYTFLSGTGRRYFLVAQPLGWIAVGLVFAAVAMWTRHTMRRGND